MSRRRSGGVLARWGVAVALALGVHATGAAALLARWQEETDAPANAPVILIDLAPITAAPAAPPEEVAPGPPQPQAEKEPEPDKPVEKTEVAPEPEKVPDKPPEPPLVVPPTPEPKPDLAVLPPKPEKKVEKKRQQQQQKHASVASAPAPAEQKADRPVAPRPGAAARNTNAVPNWKSALIAQLERHKRYPPGASDRGVTLVSFSIDRSGGVHGARIVRSSGSSVLDAATLDLVRRAAPLPPPPPEIAGAQIAIVVPVRYNAR